MTVANGVDVPIGPVPSDVEALPATACLTPETGTVLVGGMHGLQTDQAAPTLNSKPLQERIALYYLPPSGTRRSFLSQTSAALRRATLFRPKFVTPTLYALVFLVVLPGALYLALRLVAASSEAPPRLHRAAPTVFALAFTYAVCWSVITPTFNAPEENDHAAYVQYLSETGSAPSRLATSRRAAWSTEERYAIEAVRLLSQVELAETRPPWLRSDVSRAERRVEKSPKAIRPDDGGGYTAASTHSPLYYASLVPAYRVTRSPSFFTRLWAMRVFSALYGALTAVFVLLAVRELAVHSAWAWVSAGCLVAFQPMFGFISGAVNNDSGVNAGAACLMWLLLRGLRRGPVVPNSGNNRSDAGRDATDESDWICALPSVSPSDRCDDMAETRPL